MNHFLLLILLSGKLIVVMLLFVFACVFVFFFNFNRVTVNYRAGDICQPRKEGKHICVI